MRVTSLSWAASLIKLKISGFHSVGQRVYRRGKSGPERLPGAELRGGPACFRQLQEDIDIQSGSGGWRDRR